MHGRVAGGQKTKANNKSVHRWPLPPPPPPPTRPDPTQPPPVSLPMMFKICRKNCDIKPISGWTAYHDPELPKRLPLGAEVRPRCARDARVEVTRSSGREGARRARDALITKVSCSVWDALLVVHAASMFAVDWNCCFIAAPFTPKGTFCVRASFFSFSR